MSHDAGATAPQERVAHPGAAPGRRKREAGNAGSRAGRAGLAITALSIVATVAVGLAGPSAMEPALPGRPGQPPWALGLHLSPYAAVGLAAAALVAGTAGLGLCLHAMRRGWITSPRFILAAGLVAAAVITLVPPFGSSDHLSYAAYGRMELAFRTRLARSTCTGRGASAEMRSMPPKFRPTRIFDGPDRSFFSEACQAVIGLLL